MENFDTLSVNLVNEILTITIGNSAGSTCVDSKFLNELKDIINKVYDDENIKGVIITGRGEEIFATGLGIDELDRLDEINGRKFSEEGQEILSIIENCPKPIIAAVNGIAEGSAFELILACHLRLATEKASFRMPMIRLGLIPCFGATQRLPQMVGKTKAFEIMMTGSTFGVREAYEIGLINQIINYKDSMLKKATEIIEKIMMNSQSAISMLIECINDSFNLEENGYQRESNNFENCCKTEFFKNKLDKKKGDNSDFIL